VTTVSLPRLYTIAQVSEALGVSKGYVRALIADGRVRSVRFGASGWHRIPQEEVERLADAGVLEDERHHVTSLAHTTGGMT
jgi:excisionase family DNA binding protein